MTPRRWNAVTIICWKLIEVKKTLEISVVWVYKVTRSSRVSNATCVSIAWFKHAFNKVLVARFACDGQANTENYSSSCTRLVCEPTLLFNCNVYGIPKLTKHLFTWRQIQFLFLCEQICVLHPISIVSKTSSSFVNVTKILLPKVNLIPCWPVSFSTLHLTCASAKNRMKVELSYLVHEPSVLPFHPSSGNHVYFTRWFSLKIQSKVLNINKEMQQRNNKISEQSVLISSCKCEATASSCVSRRLWLVSATWSGGVVSSWPYSLLTNQA